MNKDLELLKQIGERVRNIRNGMKMNKEEFARELGITGQFLGVVESGKSTMAYDKLKKLCEISGYSADYILFGKNANVVNETKELLERYNEYDIEEICEIIKNMVVLIKKKEEKNDENYAGKVC